MNIQAGDGIHVDDGALLALIDGESAGDESRAHVDECDDCARRMVELRFVGRQVSAALDSLDVESPLHEMPAELSEAVAAAPTPIESRRRRMGGRSVAAAAGLVLVLAAGAYAVPGSPLRDVLSRSFEAVFGTADVGPVDPGPAALEVDPVDGAVHVTVLEAGSGLRMTIRLSDGSRARVSARGGSFAAVTGGVRVTDSTGDLTIELPATAEGVVEVGGTPVARVEGGVLTRLPSADDVPPTIVVETAG